MRVGTPRRRALLLAAAMLAAAVPFVSVSSAFSADEAQACADETSVLTVSKDDIPEGQALDPPLRMRSEAGGDATPLTPQPTAVRSIKELIPEPPTGRTYTSLDVGPNGSKSVLKPAEFGNAFVYVTGDQIGYIRQPRDDTDVNKSDAFTASSLELTLHTAPAKLLTPKITVSDTKIDRGTETSFSVDVTNANGTGLTYNWDFGKNEGTSTDSAPTHTYNKVGKYPVVVEVQGKDGSCGISAPTTVTVGEPAKPKTPGTGGSGGAEAGTDQKPGTGTGNTPGGAPGTGSVPLPGYTGDAPGLPAAPEEPFEGDDLLDDATQAGQEVQGFILTGSGAQTGDQIPGTADLSQATPEAEPSRRTVLLQSVVGGLAVVLLLGAGAASESRWFRTRLNHLRRRT